VITLQSSQECTVTVQLKLQAPSYDHGLGFRDDDADKPPRRDGDDERDGFAVLEAEDVALLVTLLDLELDAVLLLLGVDESLRTRVDDSEGDADAVGVLEGGPVHGTPPPGLVVPPGHFSPCDVGDPAKQ
jgi:hypothetical protein